MEEVKRINRTLVKNGHVIDLYTDTMQFPDGKTADWDLVSHKGAAAVVAVTKEGKLLMVRQYRNALERYTLEIPAGGKDSVEEPAIACAFRELEEETGYRTEHLEHLLTLNTTVAFCDEKIDLYLARNLKKTEQHLDPEEEINVEVWDIEDLKQLIYEGKLTDSKTVAGIMTYASKYHL